MIILIEPFGKPNTHLPFVKSLLFALISVSRDKIIFVANTDYFNSIPLEFREKLINHPIKKFDSKISRIFGIVVLVFKIRWIYRKNNHLRIFLLLSLSYSNFILKMTSLLSLNKDRIVYIFLHGDLQNIKLSGRLSQKFEGFIQLITYFFDSIFKSNVKFVVISGFVFSKLKESIPFKFTNFISIDFPYLYDENISKEIVERKYLVISTAGINSMQKNSHYLNIIANYFKDKIINGELKLQTTSRNDDVEFDDLIEVADMKGKYLLTWDEYSLNVKNSDLLIFFSDEKYDLICSSSYFDCINFKKPIIALYNTQWDYNFREFGELGFICSNLDEMCITINNILKDKRILENFDFNDPIQKTSVKESVKYIKDIFKL